MAHGKSCRGIDNGMIGPSESAAEVLQFPTHADERGCLTVIEQGVDLPFSFKRLYYFAAPGPGKVRGDHAHRLSHTALIALGGSFEVHVDDGLHRSTYRLDAPDRGLVVPPRHWLRVDSFLPGSLCLVLSSHLHDENDYYRDYEAFRRMVGCG